MVEVRELRKAYGDLVAVDGISFSIQPRETFGLLGPNGAGKTTTLHLLIGLLKPDGGQIDINGWADPTRAVARRQVGIAPQALSVYEDLTGGENLRFFGRLYGLKGAALRDRVGVALEQVGLTARRNDLVKTYSGGMKRRLNLACALVHDPQVLFLDEPTVGVDPQARNHILETIQALRDRGRTILFTTHYMEEAQRLCDRVAIMDHGKILAMDTVPALIDAHGGLPVIEAELEHPPADGSPLAGRVDGTTLRLETDSPFEEVMRLGATGEAIRTLYVHRPDLETVFLNLTGRSLRD